MAYYRISPGGDYFNFSLARFVRILDISSTQLVWLTETGQNVVARGSDFGVTTVDGSQVISGTITDFDVFSASGGFLLGVSGTSLPAADAIEFGRLARLLDEGDDVLSKTGDLPVRLWGGGGFDIVDYSNAAGWVSADLLNSTLNAGQAAGDRFPFIEGLIGSRFADSLNGSELRNSLMGNDGADTLSGRGGDDVLAGGAGQDSFDGGAGYDIVLFNDIGAGARVEVDLRVATATVFNPGGGNDTEALKSIEGIYGSAGADRITGSSVDNDLRGEAGNDTISGVGGHDMLFGDLGDDVLDGGQGNDQLTGGQGNDQLNGGRGSDTLSGGAGADTIDGGESPDDVDFVSYGDAASGVEIDLMLDGALAAKGGAAGDSIVRGSIEGVFGSAYADILLGDGQDNVLFGGGGYDRLLGRDGNDVLKGESGDDTLIGGLGVDTLEGGAGNDVLTGGVGAHDRFVIRANEGQDRITDFTRHEDWIDLSAIDAVGGFTDLGISFVGADTLISFTGGSIVLTGRIAVDASDFLF